MKVRMVAQRTGPRYDGQDWPGPGGEIDLPEEEAGALVAAGDAVQLPGPEPEEARVPDRPIVNAPKEDWVAYAVSQGTDPAAAEAMTKADLLAQYGPRGESAAQ